MKEKLAKIIHNKKAVVVLCVFLSVIIVVTAVSIGFSAYTPANKTLTGVELSEESGLTFKEDIIIIDADSVEKNYKETTVNENNEYEITYSWKLPSFFADKAKGDIFCVYPDMEAKEDLFKSGFCGKIVSVDEENKKVVFTVPHIEEVFKKLHISTTQSELQSVNFIPAEGTIVDADAPSLLQLSANPMTILSDFSFESDWLKFSSKQSDKESLLEDYSVLCKELKLKYKAKFKGVGISGDVTFEYPSVKFLLDAEEDAETGELIVNDYEFDFKSKEKINTTIKASTKVGLKHEETVIEKAIGSIVEISDVTSSENGKYVLGTYILGYDFPVPSMFENSTNQTSPLSFGLAIQLAITASGEITYEYKYSQMGYFEVSSKMGEEPTALLKGYYYPNPVVDAAEPDGSISQEKESVTVTKTGKMELKAGVGVDFGFCILGMIPLKLATGIEAKLISIDVDEEKNTFIENGYIKSRDVAFFAVDLYADMKFYFGIKTKIPTEIDHIKLGASTQLFRKTLFRMPEAIDFTIEECNFGGVQLGEIYTDEQLESAVKNYMQRVDDYSLFEYAKDKTLNSSLESVVQTFGISVDEFMEELKLDYPDGKIDIYMSGVIIVRDNEDRVVCFVLTGSDFHNPSGLGMGLYMDEIIGLYGNPGERVEVEYDVSEILQSLFNFDMEGVDIEGAQYKSTDKKAQMDIIAKSGVATVATIVYKNK